MRTTAWLVLSITLSACGGPGLKVLSADEIDVLPTPPNILALSGGHSVEVEDQRLWLFGDVTVDGGNDGISYLGNTAAWTLDNEANDGIDDLIFDPEPPTPFFSFTSEESSFNANNSEEQIALLPGAMVADPERDRVLIFYRKVRRSNDGLTVEVLGSSLAVYDTTLYALERPELNPDAALPTLLFTSPENPAFGAAAVAQGEWLYAFDCEGGWTKDCQVARVRLSNALDRASWEFWSGQGRGWTGSIRDVEPVFGGHTSLSVHWNVYLSRFVAIYHRPLDNSIYLRTSGVVEGPWTSELKVLDTEPSSESTINFGGIAHAPYATLDGRVQVLSYVVPTDDQRSTMRIAQIQIE